MKRVLKKSRLQNVQGAKTSAQVLAAAGRIFARKGFDGSSIRDIATAARVPIGLTLYHFKSKEKLFAETIRHHVVENSKLESLFAPITELPQKAGPQEFADAMRASAANFLGVCHGPKKVPNLNGLLLQMLTGHGTKAAQVMLLTLAEKPQDRVIPVLKSVCPHLTEGEIFSWFELFWAQVFHTITTKALILMELGAKDYTSEWLAYTAHRIAYNNCIPYGLPAPSGNVEWSPPAPTPVEAKVYVAAAPADANAPGMVVRTRPPFAGEGV